MFKQEANQELNMSKLSKQIDSTILEFCETIAQKYGLNKTEVYALWSDDQPASASSHSSPKSEKGEKGEKSDKTASVDVSEMTPEKVLTCTKDYLMAYCKSKGLKQSGKKEEIIQRVLDSLKASGSSSSSSTVASPAVKTSASKSKASAPTAPVLASVSEKSGTLEIRRNKFGNEEHFESGLVFNKETKMVIGKQNPNGKLDSLTDKDIETCKKYKFLYKLPENLSVDKGLQNVKVDELDEEDEEELDEDDIEEEEEDLDNEVDLEDD
jgi:hypothetical protein